MDPVAIFCYCCSCGSCGSTSRGWDPPTGLSLLSFTPLLLLFPPDIPSITPHTSHGPWYQPLALEPHDTPDSIPPMMSGAEDFRLVGTSSLQNKYSEPEQEQVFSTVGFSRNISFRSEKICFNTNPVSTHQIPVDQAPPDNFSPYQPYVFLTMYIPY